MLLVRSCFTQNIKNAYDFIGYYSEKLILNRSIHSHMNNDFSDDENNTRLNTNDFIADKYGIPKWYLDNYYKGVLGNIRYRNGESNSPCIYHMVLFPGRYKNCQFIDLDKAMKSIQMMIYTDLRYDEEYKKWSRYVEKNSTGWTRYDI